MNVRKTTALIGMAAAVLSIGAIRAEIQNSVRFAISAASDTVVFRLDMQTGEVCRINVTDATIRVGTCGAKK